MKETVELLNPIQRRIHQAAFRLFAEKGTSQVNILDLAQEGGGARGMAYSNIESIEGLFEEVASHLAREMHERVNKRFNSLSDPAQRLPNGIRFFIRRAHEDSHWGGILLTPTLNCSGCRDIADPVCSPRTFVFTPFVQILRRVSLASACGSIRRRRQQARSLRHAIRGLAIIKTYVDSSD